MVLPQQPVELAGRIRMAGGKRRAFELRHSPVRLGAIYDQPSAIGQHTPDLAQHRAHLLGAFQRVHQQHAIHRAVGQRHAVSSARATRLRWPSARCGPGQRITPCAAGMMAMTRSASSMNGRRNGVA